MKTSIEKIGATVLPLRKVSLGISKNLIQAGKQYDIITKREMENEISLRRRVEIIGHAIESAQNKGDFTRKFVSSCEEDLRMLQLAYAAELEKTRKEKGILMTCLIATILKSSLEAIR
jgi:hypothetical protein